MWQTIIGLISISQELLIRLIFSMLLSIGLGLVIGFIYKHTNRGMNYEASFLSTLVLLAPIVNIVMLFIQGDLVLSLGLVGSLSIIRFRTPIKDTRNMVFVFWSIATGLGTGTFNNVTVIIGNLIITIAILVLYYIDYGLPMNSQYVLVLTGTKSFTELHLAGIIGAYTSRAYVRSHQVKEGVWERVLEIDFPKDNLAAADQLVAELEKLDGLIEVSLLAPQLALPM